MQDKPQRREEGEREREREREERERERERWGGGGGITYRSYKHLETLQYYLQLKTVTRTAMSQDRL